MKRGLVLLVILFSLSFVSAVDDANIFGHKMTEIAWGDGSTCSSGVITGISSSGTAACGVSTANSLAALDGTPAQAVYVDNDGRVGIGMTAPDVPLSVAGNVRALNFIGPEDIQFGIYTNKDYSSGAAIQFYG
ncbi:MAG: hypothetical protein KKF50_04765, partial [Nanoarchaeota archaeon]|nr:hypothetical protein [Nanoarchaeota archaeon]